MKSFSAKVNQTTLINKWYRLHFFWKFLMIRGDHFMVKWVYLTLNRNVVKEQPPLKCQIKKIFIGEIWKYNSGIINTHCSCPLFALEFKFFVFCVGFFFFAKLKHANTAASTCLKCCWKLPYMSLLVDTEIKKIFRIVISSSGKKLIWK